MKVNTIGEDCKVELDNIRGIAINVDNRTKITIRESLYGVLEISCSGYLVIEREGDSFILVRTPFWEKENEE